MQTEINYNDILRYLQDYPIDCNSEDDIHALIDSDELKNVICIGKQFIYFACFIDEEMNFSYITPSVYDVLGYKPEELSTKEIYGLIHPADRGLIIKATLKSVEYQKKLRMKPMQYIFHMDFRLKKKNGEYIRVSRQTTNFKNDKNGLMVLSIAIISDISKIKTSNTIDFYWTGPDDNRITFPDNELVRQNSYLTKREKQVIKLLSFGDTSKTIADKLNISKHTVDTHRSNILEKLSLKNTAEIIAYTTENHIV